MAGTDGVGLCSYAEMADYLKQVGEDRLLEFIRETEGRYDVVPERLERVKAPSVRYQVACVLALLGEYTRAGEVHSLKWDDLSGWGDKVGNNLLKHFMKSYPPR